MMMDCVREEGCIHVCTVHMDTNLTIIIRIYLMDYPRKVI